MATGGICNLKKYGASIDPFSSKCFQQDFDIFNNDGDNPDLHSKAYRALANPLNEDIITKISHKERET